MKVITYTYFFLYSLIVRLFLFFNPIWSKKVIKVRQLQIRKEGEVKRKRVVNYFSPIRLRQTREYNQWGEEEYVITTQRNNITLRVKDIPPKSFIVVWIRSMTRVEVEIITTIKLHNQKMETLKMERPRPVIKIYNKKRSIIKKNYPYKLFKNYGKN